MAETKVIVIPDGKICDYIDGKFRNDTPEEYVRQTIEKRLVNEHKYLPKQIKIEYTLQLGSRKPRADIVVFDKDCTELTQENVKIIIECKKETVEARNAKDGVEQLKSYMSACPNCEWGMWTNGKQKEVFRKFINDKGQIDFMDYNDIPSADGSLDDINRPKRTSLKNAYDDNLLFVFKTCHNHIHVYDGLQKQPAFFELLKVIFCKIEDERNIPNPLDFYTTSDERSNPDGQLTVKKRISKIFERVKKKHGKIFDSNDEIKLAPRSLAYIVSELQKYSLLNTNIDIKGKAYEEIVGANLRGDRGEFFTPRNVMKMVVEMINPKMDERVLDSSCGTGGFLVTAMTHVIADLERELEGKVYSDDVIRVTFKNIVDLGYCYTFLKSKIGNTVLQTNGYGSVITHLEPEHLQETFIPSAPFEIKERIHNLIMNSYELRDKSNELIDQATGLLIEELKLPAIADFNQSNIKNCTSLTAFNVKLSELNYRTDASYHLPVVDAIVEHLKKNAKEVTTIGDERISKQIILAGVFKRTYVEEEYGYPFLGGKEITQLSPKTEKYLSKPIHKNRYEKELKVTENTILITDRGTIGITTLVPKHWNGYAVSQNVLKLIPANDCIAGYVYIFLNSEWGSKLIRRHTYGSVVDMIDNNSLASVEIPLLKNQTIQDKINNLALKANEMRYEAYCLEQEALKIMDEEVIYAK